MENCTDCWLCKDVEKHFSCTITGGLYITGVTKCKRIITDEDIMLAQREECSKQKICFINDCRKCPESVIFDPNLHGTVAFDSAVEGAKAATDEDTDTDKLTCANCSFASKSDVRVFPAGISSSIPLPGGVFYCPERNTRVPGTLEGCDFHSERKKAGESNLDEANFLNNTIDECFREMKRLIGDMEFPDIGIKFDQHGCPVPIFLPTIEQLRQTITYKQSSTEERLKMEERLASDRRKSKRTPEGKARHLLDRMGIEGAFDFTSGNIVELAELISEVDQLRKEAAITKRIRAERDALKVCNEKLSKDNKALLKKIALLDAQNKVVTRYAEEQDKNFEHRYEELEELKEEVNSLGKELKTANLDRVATEQSNSQICMEFDMVNQDLVAHKCLSLDLESKLARIKEELFGKWRLLEVGEEPQKGDQALLIDSNNVRIWVEPNGFKGIVKEETVLVRRKITI